MGKQKPATLTAIKGGSKKNGAKAKAKDEIKTRRPSASTSSLIKKKDSRSVSKTQLKKKRSYTDAELGIPTLNGIVPTGVVKTRGKKGKVFVDDAESLKTIMAMVNATQEGHIESKLAKARHLEEIREAKKAESEVRQSKKRSAFEETKDSLRRKRNRKSNQPEGDGADRTAPVANPDPSGGAKKKKSTKRVTFG